MKKIAIMTVILAMMLSLAIPASAVPYGGYLGMVPETTAEIAIDGEKDDAYDDALVIPVDQQLFGYDVAVRATANAYMLFTEGTLYVYVEIADGEIVIPTPDKQTIENAWNTDSFEVILDTNNTGAETDLIQYRIDCSGFATVQDRYATEIGAAGEDAEEYFKSGVKTITNGYAVEFEIPITTTEIGVSLLLNDFGNDGSVTYAQCRSELTGRGPGAWNSEYYPFITLGFEKPLDTLGEEITMPAQTDPEEPEESEPEESDKTTQGKEETENKAPETKPQNTEKGGCGGSIGTAALLLLAAAPAVLLKKKED